MNSLESKIDRLLTRYLGVNWKTFTGCVLFVVAFIVRCFVTHPDARELLDIAMAAGLTLAGVGGYHKITRSTKMAEQALAQSHEARLPREG